MSGPSRQYFKELRLQQFRSLVTLSHCRSFSAAATALKLTRSSVWQQVRALEQEFACALLHPRGQRMELTAAGHKLVELAGPIVAGFDSIKSGFDAALEYDPRPTLALAAAPNFLLQELRDPIASIHEEFPALELKFLEQNSAAAAETVDQGGADCGIVARPEHVSPRPALEYTSLGAYPFHLICPAGHPLLRKRRLALTDFTQHPLILPASTTYCRQHFDAIMARAGLTDKVRITIEAGFPLVLLEYVRIGLGVGISPLPADPRPVYGNAGGIRPVPELLGTEPIYFVRRKGHFETSAAARFRQLMQAQAKRTAS